MALILYRFLLTKLQLEYILDNRVAREPIKAFETLPADVKNAYSEELVCVTRAGGRNIAIKILSWLFHARRQLKVHELQEAILIETCPLDSDDSHLSPEHRMSAE